MANLTPTEIPTTSLQIRRALVSVSDKTNLSILAEAFRAQSIEVLSTGGTAAALRDLGVAVQDVADYTGFPEILDGRVKTLHPRVHGGILGRKGLDDQVLELHDIAYFDLVVVNLYPFSKAIEAGGDYSTAIENIDIGGPSMLRAAAKNHGYLAVLSDPEDYQGFALAMAASGEIDFETRQRWAFKAFSHSAEYDAAIAQYLGAQLQNARSTPMREMLRYGENPHQEAVFVRSPTAATGTLGAAELLQGKALSYNNLADADAALECVKCFETPACVIVKHANPCGVATASTSLAAYQKAYECDKTSAFGGILAFNRPLSAEVAQQVLDNQYAEVILAPAVEIDAQAVLSQKPNIRVLATGVWDGLSEDWQVKVISGGELCQSADTIRQTPEDWQVVSKRQPTEAELADMQFAWSVVRFVKSNAIVFAKDQKTVGIGAGQMSRVMSVKIAGMKADEAALSTQGAVMASDAFFPFADGIEAALEKGITAVIHPGGSRNDSEVIAAADAAGIAMIMTGTRHFKH